MGLVVLLLLLLLLERQEFFKELGEALQDALLVGAEPDEHLERVPLRRRLRALEAAQQRQVRLEARRERAQLRAQPLRQQPRRRPVARRRTNRRRIP